MIKVNKTFEEIKKNDSFKSYAVKCDSEKYATHESKDGVLFCFYGSHPIELEALKETGHLIIATI